jgi:hypothetical protein
MDGAGAPVGRDGHARASVNVHARQRAQHRESGAFPAPLALGLCESGESECEKSEPGRDSGTAGRGAGKYVCIGV